MASSSLSAKQQAPGLEEQPWIPPRPMAPVAEARHGGASSSSGASRPSFRTLLNRHWHAAVTYCAVFWSFGMCVAFLGPTLLDLGCMTGSDMRDVSWVFLAQLLCSLFGASAASYLVNRCEANYILAVNTILLALCMFVIPFCQVLPALAFVLAVMGFNMGCVDTLANLQMINVFGESVPPFLQVLHFCYGLGAFVSPMIAEPFLLNEDCSVFIDNVTQITSLLNADVIGDQNNMEDLPAKTLVEAQQMTKVRFAFWIMSVMMVPIPGLVVSLRMGFTLTGWKLGHQELADTDPAAGAVKTEQPTGCSEYGAIIKLAEEKVYIDNNQVSQHPKQLQQPTRHQKWAIIGGVAALLFIFDGLQSAYGGFVYSYAVKSIVDLSRTEGAYLNALFWGSFATGRLFSIPLATWFTPSFMLLCNISGSLFAMTLMLILRHDHVTLYIGTCLFGLFLSSIAPTAISVAEMYIEITPSTTSILVVVAALGEMACPVIVGNMFNDLGPGSFLAFGDVMCFLAAGVFLGLWHVGKQTPKHVARGGSSFIWSHMSGIMSRPGEMPHIVQHVLYIGKRPKSNNSSNIELDRVCQRPSEPPPQQHQQPSATSSTLHQQSATYSQQQNPFQWQ